MIEAAGRDVDLIGMVIGLKRELGAAMGTEAAGPLAARPEARRITLHESKLEGPDAARRQTARRLCAGRWSNGNSFHGTGCPSPRNESVRKSIRPVTSQSPPRGISGACPRSRGHRKPAPRDYSAIGQHVEAVSVPFARRPARRRAFEHRRGLHLIAAATPQAKAAARYPSPGTRPVGRLCDGVLSTLRRRAERSGRNIAMRARAARPWRLRHWQRLGRGCSRG